MPTLEERVSALERKFEQSENKNFKRFEMIWDCLQGIKVKLENLQNRIENLESRMDRLEARMDRLEARMDILEDGMKRVENKLDQILIILQERK